jgi:hypothetical protein
VKARFVTNRPCFMVWRESGAVRNARPGRGGAASTRRRTKWKKGRRSLPFENDGSLLCIGSQHTGGTLGAAGIDLLKDGQRLRTIHRGFLLLLRKMPGNWLKHRVPFAVFSPRNPNGPRNTSGELPVGAVGIGRSTSPRSVGSGLRPSESVCTSVQDSVSRFGSA